MQLLIYFCYWCFVFLLQYTRRFELINYSSYGTYVNNILYSNDLTERNHAASADKKPPNVETQVREIIDKKRKVSRGGGGNNNSSNSNHHRRNSFEGKMTAIDCMNNQMECSCSTNNLEDLRGGWEGSAILSHGSLLRFGCVSFVFSIVDCASV